MTALKKISIITIDVWDLLDVASDCKVWTKSEKEKSVNCAVKQKSSDRGNALEVNVGEIRVLEPALKVGEEFHVSIAYKIDSTSESIQFLKASETSTKIHPFFYSINKPL